MPSRHRELARGLTAPTRLLQGTNCPSPLTAARDHVLPPAQHPAMEEIHMSPTPTPPMQEPDGEDPCIIDVNDAAIDGVTMLICLCGLVGNGSVIWFLGFRIRWKTIAIYIQNLTYSDFGFLILVFTSSFFYMIENVSCSTLGFLKHLRGLSLLSIYFYTISLYLLMAISIESCVSILCPLWYHCRRPQRLSAVVCALLWALSITLTVVVASLCVYHEPKHCEMGLITILVLNLLFFATPMVISEVILFFKVLCGSQRRQPRRLHTVIFLTVLFFLLFGVPLSICNFLQQLRHHLLSFKVDLLLVCIKSSINPFIYLLVGCCQRPCSFVSLQVAFRRVFEEPEDNSTHNNQIPMDTLHPDSPSISNCRLNCPRDSG